jgi:cytosine/adenosine deaminase-related metal-dependent hydrolase
MRADGPMGERFATDGDWELDGFVGGGSTPSETLGAWRLSVRDGVIVTLEPSGEPRGPAPERPCLVAAPLLVNAHDHGRGRGNVRAGIADAPLEPWIRSLRRPGQVTSQAALVGDGCRAMLAAGVGATVLCVNPQSSDITGEVAAAAEVVSDLGLRAAVVYPFSDAMDDVYGRERLAIGWDSDEVARHLAAAETVAAGIDDPRIEVQLGPVGPQWVSEATLAAVGRHAAATGRRVHMHLLESPAQRAWVDRTYPEGILDLLDRVGLLGPHVCFAHGTQLRPDEIAGLAEHGCVLALNASSNLRLASGIPPVAEALAAGLELGAGLDGMALGDAADYWNELRLLRGLGQAQSGASIDASVLLGRLSAGGGRALGAGAPVDPAVGRTADFVLLDLTGFGHLMHDHQWSAADVALAAGRPGRVAELWVGGRQVYASQGVDDKRNEWKREGSDGPWPTSP